MYIPPIFTNPQISGGNGHHSGAYFFSLELGNGEIPNNNCDNSLRSATRNHLPHSALTSYVQY